MLSKITSFRASPFKLPWEMEDWEIVKRKKELREKMQRAADNYEFYYFNELKTEYESLVEHEKVRKEWRKKHD